MIDISRALSGQIRSSDFIARYAGDEFVALLQVSADEAKEMIQRIQRTLERQDFRVGGSGINIGISAGFAGFETDGSTLDELLIAADRNMYANKLKRKEEQENASRVSDSKRLRAV